MENLKIRLHFKSILTPHKILALLFVMVLLMGCKSETNQPAEALPSESNIDSTFDSSKWEIRQGKDYPYRKSMLSTLVYTDTLRKLKRNQWLIYRVNHLRDSIVE